MYQFLYLLIHSRHIIQLHISTLYTSINVSQVPMSHSISLDTIQSLELHLSVLSHGQLDKKHNISGSTSSSSSSELHPCVLYQVSWIRDLPQLYTGIYRSNIRGLHNPRLSVTQLTTSIYLFKLSTIFGIDLQLINMCIIN